MEGKDNELRAPGRGDLDTETTEEVLRELVEHFREAREPLRGQWVEAMNFKGLTKGLTPEETESESVKIYDTCVDCIDSGQYGSAVVYARSMAERGVLRGMSPEEIIGGMLTLRDAWVSAWTSGGSGRPETCAAGWKKWTSCWVRVCGGDRDRRHPTRGRLRDGATRTHARERG